jgi:hypothetical protein
MIAIWNGSAWRYIAATTPTNGTVLQVATGSTSTEVAINSAVPNWVDTGLSATITPRSSSSKILIQCSIQNRVPDVNGQGAGFRVVRGSTAVYTDGSSYGVGYSSNASGTSARSFLQYFDSPSSTSSLTYKIQAVTFGATGVHFQDDGHYASTMTLWEIAA